MELQVVVFKLADEDYGVPIEQVREINRMVPITAVPKAPASVLGVINLRDQIIPVVSLRERFGFPAEAQSEATRIVVSEVGGQVVGFVVDSVNEVLRLNEEAIESAPPSTAGVDSAFIKGIGKLGERLVIMLDLERIFDFRAPAC